MMRKFIIIITLALAFKTAEAKVSLPSLLSDNAVLQQQSEVKLWGKATGKKVEVKASWSDEAITARVSKDGRWECLIPTPLAGEGYSISFDDGQVTTISNLLIGEVWLSSGQSNMKVPIKGNVSQPIEGSADMILHAKASRAIRLFTVPERHAFTPLEECDGEWVLYTPENVAAFGATPLFFADYLQGVLDIPVGIVNCSWGGSTIEAWIPRPTLEGYKEYDFAAIDREETLELPQTQHTLLYNGMMHAMKNLKFKGMLWYQGEANRKNHEEYPELFARFASMLRSHFECGEFPIYYAQIAPYGFGPAGKGAAMRVSQSEIMAKVNRTGMVTLSDVGEHDCIHPRHKREAGERFAYWALGDTYGYAGMEYRAPEFAEMTQLEAAGKLPKRIALRFNHALMGLSLPADSVSENFEVAGADGIYYPAQMKLVTKAEYPLQLWSDQVDEIKAVRYGYKDYFKGDVFNNFGIPLSTFCAEM